MVGREILPASGHRTRRKVPPSPLKGATDLMSTWSHYRLVNTITEALHVLASASGSARPIAGGTDLLLEIQQGRHPPVDTLVDLTRIPELRCLEIRQSELFIGSAVPVRQITENALVQQHARALLEACSLIGGPQVRNTATLGGNVAHALPAADGTIALVALDARAEIANRDGRRLVPILDLLKGSGNRLSLWPTRKSWLGFTCPCVNTGRLLPLGA